MKEETAALLRHYAETYETEAFINGDPSWFMHQVRGGDNQEATAFIASSLSYGSRQQFMKKIGLIMDWSGGDVDRWVREGRYASHFTEGCHSSFYRLYSYDAMHRFLSAYRQLLHDVGTLGAYVRREATDGLGAVQAICRYFSSHGCGTVIPQDTQSACKRLCMFMRWMVRSGSPVDIGLWAHFIDRRTLIMPLDTHVLQQSVRLGLMGSKTATMPAARRLTEVLATVFPDDPLRGDFALFGFGVTAGK